MSDREMCIKLLDNIPEYKLKYLIAYIQGLTADESPNETTVEALKEAEAMEKHPELYKRYTSFDELLAEVNTDA